MTQDPNDGHFQKRSLSLLGHKTSISLEKAFWRILEEAAHTQNISLSHLVKIIDEKRTESLASSLRLYALAYLLEKNSS